MAEPTEKTVESAPDSGRAARNGTIAAFGCYVLWGLLPIFWKALGEANSFEIVGQRMVWAFVFMSIWCLATGIGLFDLIKQKRARRYLTASALIIAVNWTTFIVAVNSGHIVDTSLGYYINPLVTILFGLLMFHERMTPLQLAAFILCAAGIIFFTVDYGRFPWVSLTLAITFGLYGAIKKKGGYPPVASIATENIVLLPVGLVICLVTALVTGDHVFFADTGSVHGWTLTGLMVLTGVVTALPLVLFSKAANDISMVTLGFIQYVSPTLTLLLGVFVYGEPFTLAHAVCFGCIWLGLVLVGVDSVRRSRKAG